KRTTEPARVEVLGASGYDRRVGARCGPFEKELARRTAKERLDRCQSMGAAHRFGPPTMFVEEDVAEDHVGDPVALQFGEREAELLVVGAPRAAAHELAQLEALGLGGENLGPQPVRAASSARLVEHRHHCDDVEAVTGA